MNTASRFQRSQSIKPTVAQMRAHIRQLCAANRIMLNYDRHASASRELREIWVRAIRSPRAYAVAMHEIGHVLGGYQLSRSTLVRERWAWHWAQRNALRWTPEMRRHADRCLEHYARQESFAQHKELTRLIGKRAGESFSER
jgi:hypothetical protein